MTAPNLKAKPDSTHGDSWYCCMVADIDRTIIVNVMAETRDKAEARARLIAAAPDLLAACKHGNEADISAAIAKAQGDTT